MIAFKVLDPSERVPVSNSRLKVNLVFDIKLDLTRKTWLVAEYQPLRSITLYGGRQNLAVKLF